MHIETDDLSRHAIHALLEEHLRDMHTWSPPESVHALDLAKLRQPDITFWSAWDGALLLGCGALKELDPSVVAKYLSNRPSTTTGSADRPKGTKSPVR